MSEEFDDLMNIDLSTGKVPKKVKTQKVETVQEDVIEVPKDRTVKLYVNYYLNFIEPLYLEREFEMQCVGKPLQQQIQSYIANTYHREYQSSLHMIILQNVIELQS